MSYFEEHGGCPSIEKHNVFAGFWCYSLGGLGLTDRVIAVRPEFPAPCGCGLWLWAAGCGAAANDAQLFLGFVRATEEEGGRPDTAGRG